MTKFAIVFPGQGSQSVAMLSELSKQYPVVKQTFEQASSAIDVDLWQLSQQGPEQQLNQTEYTQPALLAAGIAVWRVWQNQQGTLPDLVAGHSLGEYTALVCAGAIQFEDAIQLVNKRGQYMQSAVPAGTGAMAAILGLDDQQVIDICQQASESQIVSAANFNSPGQVVIAGDKDAVERAIGLAKSAGAKRALPLPVSVPSHCALMQPAAEELAKDIDAITISPPKISVINNVDVALYTNEQSIKEGLLRQLYCSVRWVELIQTLALHEVQTIYEFGPGKVLTGLNKRINSAINVLAVNDQQSLLTALEKEG